VAAGGSSSSDPKHLERLEEAARRSEVAKRQFGKLRDVCISAQQVRRRLLWICCFLGWGWVKEGWGSR